MIVYCRRCVMPETRPDLHIGPDGICNACKNHESTKEIDWEARQNQFVELIDRYRSPETGYDCLIPVSGGKDSHYQVLRVLELGATPLCVTATTDRLTDIGRRNIENLKSLGVDYIEVTANPTIRRRINRLALREVGDISWPEHVTIFTIPVRVAVQTGIRLIVWGENPQHEYGGPAVAAANSILDRRWLEEFGGLLGLRVSDLVGQDGIEERHLTQYSYPSDEELQRVGVTGVFLGYFTPWDGYGNALYAQANGFETYPTAIEGSLVNYENLDNGQTGIHDYFKFLKFGFGRATDLASMHVRRGRLRRSEAIELVRRHDGHFPWSYVGVPLEEVLRDIEVSVDEFERICDRFTNKKLFLTDARGALIRNEDRSLTKVNYDNVAEEAVPAPA